MEVGTEISQKIRSAIKAKLLELGAYVDDELPDYIMVMVANKKSRAQMTKDLGLFLGANTDAFTEWLHNLLGKLQTIRVDSDKAAEKQSISDKSKSTKEKKKTAKDKSPKGDGSKSKDRDKKKTRKHSIDTITKRKVTSTDEAQDQTNSEAVGEKTDSVETATDVRDGACQSTGEDSSGVVTISKQIKDRSQGSHEDIEDVRQLLVTTAPGDELAEELETTEVDIVKSGTEKSVAKVAVTQQKTNDTRTTSAIAGSELGHGAQPSGVSRKRKVPSSVVASVTRQDDEEEYDPYNPAVGSVASVVKVTSRKPSVPPSLQANRLVEDETMESTDTTESQADSGEPPSKMIKLSNTLHLDHIKQALAEVLENSYAKKDTISHFCEMVESSLRKLQPRDLSLAKLQIQKVLVHFETSVAPNSHTPSSVGEGSARPESIAMLKSECSNNNTCGSAGSSSEAHIQSNSIVGGLVNHLKSPKLSNVDKTDLLESSQLTPSSLAAHSHHLSSHVNLSASVADDQNISQRLDQSLAVEKEEDASKQMAVDPENHGSTSSMHKPISERIIFRPKPKAETQSSTRSMRSLEDSNSQFNIDDSSSKPRERIRRHSGKDQISQSPVSSSKAESGSPSSTHSCPPSSTSGHDVRQCIVSTSSKSRESTLSPSESKSQFSSLVGHTRASTPTNKSLPSILVDSIHNKKRAESEYGSVLKQNWSRDRSPRAAPPSDNDDTVDSPRQYSTEALRVLAKNLKVTVINKRAVNSQQGSSSDDSSSDDSEDDTSDDDEEENEDNANPEEDKDKDAATHKSEQSSENQ